MKIFLLEGYDCGLCLLEGQRQSAKNIIHCKNKQIQIYMKKLVQLYKIIKFYDIFLPSTLKILTSPNNSPESRVAKAKTVYDPQTGNPRSSIK